MELKPSCIDIKTLPLIELERTEHAIIGNRRLYSYRLKGEPAEVLSQPNPETSKE